jgi:hypothetical protein
MNPQEGIGCPSAPLRRGPERLEFEVQGIMLKVAPVSTKNLSLCIAVAVACAGMATEPEKVRPRRTLVFRESTGRNKPVCSIGVIIVKLAHAIGRVLKSMEGRAGRWATFGTGIAVSFVAHLPASGSRAPTSVSHGGRDCRVLAALSIPQGNRGSNYVRGCLVVSCAYHFSHGGQQANEKHGQEKICVWRNSRREVLFEFPHENAGLEALHVHGEPKQFKIRLPLALSKLLSKTSFKRSKG